ncbi:HWE histidine kinase domain-containing protein [Caulobacter sp. 73W]|uniref:histidine kinase n=1 Tax=Caulobacter sp. 73W TaxID=3161137 RepID=A0AB39KXP8_9CAUL
MAALVALNVAEARRSQERALLADARAVAAAVDTELVRNLQLADALADSEAVSERDWVRARQRIDRAALGPDRWVAISDATGARVLNTFVGPPSQTGRPEQGLPRPRNILAALQTGRPLVSDLFWGPRSGRYVVGIDAPARYAQGDVVVSLVIDPARFLQVTARQKLPPRAMVTLIDGQRRVLARSRDHHRYLNASATAEMIAAMKKGPEGVVASRSLEGEKTMVAYAPSRVAGWTTLVVVPKRSLIGPIWTNVLGVTLVVLLAGSLGVLVVSLQARSISRELDALENDAKAVGHGQIVNARSGTIANFDRVQAALAGASFELERREARQKLMINELNHRVKNTLATVQALAMQTFRQVDGDARAKFEERLSALGQAHDLLTISAWARIDIHDVVGRCAIRPDNQIDLEGPSVLLPPEAALALCMIIHELTTNSIKYGALSTLEGRIEVQWRTVGERRVDFLWRETGGPRVSAPERKGFGTRLMDRLARHELNGRIERIYDLEGLVVQGRFELSDQSRWADV